ncbi:major facilitator superfamily MFS_1 [Actinokineospora spheciospongiae]|uniref:Major facilitator superfamily MFS_1 n=1 Tax=Actinokineospora spheciospongiae TaxID=909613 RepID=W7IN68_9PSEU|nr:MFS transporter [Actinokineospora spheciospongiae]EWC58192.1 major facilitator superfamily MFS_1 [Actinokineospora spheciospongiae]PWW62483.1 sugar phosphate permease [Actinokineospora spheciospongiae]
MSSALASDAKTAGRRGALLIWATAAAVYLMAVFHRTSLGVAGLEAAERFHIGSAALGTFTVLQIGVYAAMQIPTGLLVDRFGPRRVLTAAALFMGLGQLLFAFAASFPLALTARAVLGLGDAMTFVSVLRVVAAHYPPRRYATLAAITATFGSFGNLVATVPLTLLLDNAGWTTTFAIAGGLTFCYSLAVALRVRDTPRGTPAQPAAAIPLRQVAGHVRAAWVVPGTRLGFWVHFTTMFTPAALGLLWGFPYLVQAQGMSDAQAGAVLSLLVVVGMVLGPFIGETTGRRPILRLPIVWAFLTGAITVWAVLLGWPGGVVPGPVVVAAIGFLSLGSPVSSIAFALARDYNPIARVGTATGVVNVGGFCAITTTSLAVGVLLGGNTADAGPADFRVAFLAIAALLLLGTWRTWVWWRRARAAVFAATERGEAVPVRIRRRAWDIPTLAAGEAQPEPATP